MKLFIREKQGEYVLLEEVFLKTFRIGYLSFSVL